MVACTDEGNPEQHQTFATNYFAFASMSKHYYDKKSYPDDSQNFLLQIRLLGDQEMASLRTFFGLLFLVLPL